MFPAGKYSSFYSGFLPGIKQQIEL